MRIPHEYPIDSISRFYGEKSRRQVPKSSSEPSTGAPWCWAFKRVSQTIETGGI
jgi:hypothetical protein